MEEDTLTRQICAPCAVSTQMTSPWAVAEQAAVSFGDRDTLVENCVDAYGVSRKNQASAPVATSTAWM